MPTTLLLLPSSGIKGGNYYTMERIQSHLKECGHTCHLWDVQELKEKGDVNKVLKDNQVDLVIGIHAFRTGEVLKDCKVPYILILGGTDVNIFSEDTHQLEVMTSAVTCARRVISFSDSLQKKARKLWRELPASKLVVISQAVKTNPRDRDHFNLIRRLEEEHGIEDIKDRRIFLLVGAVRPVKDPIYLMETFSQLQEKNPKILFVIIGPVSDEHYHKHKFQPALQSYRGVVVHIPGLPQEDTHAAIQQSFALVNSSESEGMSLAILEAMQLKTPVLARDIEGNSAVIEDDKNGLLFSEPKEFLEKALRLLYCNKCKDRLVVNAEQDVAKLYNVETEKKAYLEIVQQNSTDTRTSTDNRSCRRFNLCMLLVLCAPILFIIVKKNY